MTKNHRSSEKDQKRRQIHEQKNLCPITEIVLKYLKRVGISTLLSITIYKEINKRNTLMTQK